MSTALCWVQGEHAHWFINKIHSYIFMLRYKAYNVIDYNITMQVVLQSS